LARGITVLMTEEEQMSPKEVRLNQLPVSEPIRGVVAKCDVDSTVASRE